MVWVCNARREETEATVRVFVRMNVEEEEEE